MSAESEPVSSESAAPEAQETQNEETAVAEEAEQAPAPEENEEESQEEDTDDGLGYNNVFPDDGAAEHKAVIGSTCNLRAGAGYNYKVITVLEQGTPVTVIGEVSKGWYHVSCEAGDGYIGTKFVDFG